jgi:hypothetical protein
MSAIAPILLASCADSQSARVRLVRTKTNVETYLKLETLAYRLAGIAGPLRVISRHSSLIPANGSFGAVSGRFRYPIPKAQSRTSAFTNSRRMRRQKSAEVRGS